MQQRSVVLKASNYSSKVKDQERVVVEEAMCNDWDDRHAPAAECGAGLLC
jgi:hypothetical protein